MWPWKLELSSFCLGICRGFSLSFLFFANSMRGTWGCNGKWGVFSEQWVVAWKPLLCSLVLSIFLPFFRPWSPHLIRAAAGVKCGIFSTSTTFLSIYMLICSPACIIMSSSQIILQKYVHFVTQGEEGISSKAFHYLGHFGSGAGAQNTLVRQVYGCLFKISLFTVACRFCSRRGMQSVHTRRRTDSELFTGVTEALSIQR